MKTAIFASALIVADAIRSGYTDSLPTGRQFCIGFLIGLFAVTDVWFKREK